MIPEYESRFIAQSADGVNIIYRCIMAPAPAQLRLPRGGVSEWLCHPRGLC